MRSKFTIFLILSTSFFLFASSPSLGEVNNFSDEFSTNIDAVLWDVRNEIVITNPSSLLTDYQVLIDIPDSFDYSFFQPNGADIRFVNSNNDSLAHWVEDWNVSGNSSIWVNCPSLASGNTSIFMYYNNSAAPSVSNGTNIFDFFDDFEGQNLGAFPDGWFTSPNPNINLSVSSTSKIGDRGLFVDQSPDPTGNGLRNFNVDAVGKIFEY